MVDEVNGGLRGRIGGPAGDKMSHSRQAIDERQDAVERLALVDPRRRKPNRPIHVQVLPGKVRGPDDFCASPGRLLYCAVALTSDAR